MSSLTTTCNRKARLLGRLKDIIISTESFGRTHNAHLEAMKSQMYNTDDYKRAPQWVKCYLMGYHDRWFDTVWYTQLHYTYVVNGKRMNIKSTEYREATKDIASMLDYTETGAYVWRKSGRFFTMPNEGADRPFSME